MLIARVLHYLRVQRALRTLVIPFWPSSSFWPLITCTYAAAVQGYVLEAVVAVFSCTAGTQILFWGRNLFEGKLQALGLIFFQFIPYKFCGTNISEPIVYQPKLKGLNKRAPVSWLSIGLSRGRS